jgi:hypothetical protein
VPGTQKPGFSGVPSVRFHGRPQGELPRNSPGPYNPLRAHGEQRFCEAKSRPTPYAEEGLQSKTGALIRLTRRRKINQPRRRADAVWLVPGGIGWYAGIHTPATNTIVNFNRPEGRGIGPRLRNKERVPVRITGVLRFCRKKRIIKSVSLKLRKNCR